VPHRFRLAAHHARRQQPFVVGKRLVRDERPRQVELARRPRPIGAERAQIADHAIDLPAGQRIAESRHEPIERADRTAPSNDRNPVARWFLTGERTVGEVGQPRGESRLRARRAPTVIAMARGAAVAIQIRAAPPGLSRGGADADARESTRKKDPGSHPHEWYDSAEFVGTVLRPSLYR